MIASWYPMLPRVFSTARFSVRFGILVAVLLLPGLLWGSGRTYAQDTETQQFSFEQGENFVSLRVQPEDAPLSAIFEGHLDQVHRVKDERGRVYMPSNGIEQFTTWEADESYKVYTTSSFDLEVTGSPLSLITATVPLEKGGNLIPYLPADPQAVDDALASVSSTLVRVGDEAGNVHEPGDALSTLDSLRAGQGYKLYVDQLDTLTYTIQTGTLAEALNLEGIQAGQHISTRGRNEPGDGGGGMFVAMNSACRTDGGICFMFDEDLTQVTESTTIDHTNLSWRSVEVRYGDDTSKDVIHQRQLNGFHEHRSAEPTPWIDLVNGSVRDFGWSPLPKLRDNTSGNALYYTYEHTSSIRRLERKNVGNSVKPEWWGAPKLDPNNPKEADPELRWALVVANRIYKNNNYGWVNVEVEDGFYYQVSIPILEGVKILGTGNLNADGFTRGELRLMPGEALFWRKNDYDKWADPDRERTHNAMLGMEAEQIRAGHQPEKFGMEEMLVNGNVPNNMQLFNNLGDYDQPISMMQDGGSLQGFYDIGQDWLDTTTPFFHDVHFKDAGGSGLSIGAAGGNADPDVDNVRIDQARRNHLIYGVSGANPIKDVTVTGQFWGAGAILTDPRDVSGISAEYQNFTLKDIKTGQFGYNTIVSLRGGSAGFDSVLVDNFTIDLSESSMQGYLGGNLSVLKVLDDNAEFRGGTIRGYKPANYNISNPPVLMDVQVEDGDMENEDDPVILKNTNVYDHGVQFQLAKKGGTAPRNLRVENVTVQAAQGFTRSSGSRGIIGTYKAPASTSVPRQWRIFYKDLNWLPSAGSHNFQIFADDGDHPLDWYVSGGSLNNNPEYDALVNYHDTARRAARLFLHNFDLDFRDADSWHADVRPGDVGRLRDVTDTSTGYVSDKVGQTYTSDATDEGNSFVLIETRLLAHAHAKSATVTSGAPSVTSVEVANEDGTTRTDKRQQNPYLKVNLDQSIGAGNTIEVEWTARVTPTDQYSTTGLFVARAVSDKSYTSGNGPFTYDLRGVASTQESREKIVYTASSDDTSVVAANVQSDDYMLELTEQSAGTATVTVTGEIPGVGTAAMTFEVTVE